MKFRLIASAILIGVLLALYGAFHTDGGESSTAPAASVQSNDDNQFKGLGK